MDAACQDASAGWLAVQPTGRPKVANPELIGVQHFAGYDNLVGLAGRSLTLEIP